VKFQSSQTITSTYLNIFDFPKIGKVRDVTDIHEYINIRRVHYYSYPWILSWTRHGEANEFGFESGFAIECWYIFVVLGLGGVEATTVSGASASNSGNDPNASGGNGIVAHVVLCRPH
jgi:hypothetical protein